jgi:hypothetical protein
MRVDDVAGDGGAAPARRASEVATRTTENETTVLDRHSTATRLLLGSQPKR